MGATGTMDDGDAIWGELPKDATREGYTLLVHSFTLRDLVALWDFNLFMTLRLVPGMMARGFNLLAAGTQLTGSPGRVVHVWRRAADSRGRRVPGARALLDELSGYVRDEAIVPMRPTSYDPLRWLPGDAAAQPRFTVDAGGASGSRVYLMDTVSVVPGRMREFVSGKRDVMIPLIARGVAAPWTLLASGWVRGAGDPVAMNVWEMPDSDALLRTMRRVSENIAYQDFVRECVRAEDQHVLCPVDFYEPRARRAERDGALVVAYP